MYPLSLYFTFPCSATNKQQYTHKYITLLLSPYTMYYAHAIHTYTSTCIATCTFFRNKCTADTDINKVQKIKRMNINRVSNPNRTPVCDFSLGVV